MIQRKQKITGAIISGLALMCLFGFALARGYTQHSERNLSSVVIAVAQSDVAHERVQSPLPVSFFTPPQRPRVSNILALPLALRMNGFAPAEIERPTGDFLISVTNFSGFPDVVFRLDRENGERLHSAKVPRDKLTWRQHVRLTPGSYLLTVMDHPEWSCRITITTQ